MNKYGNWIYVTPLVLGALASVFATAWRFLGVRQDPAETTPRGLFALPRRIREVKRIFRWRRSAVRFRVARNSKHTVD